MGDQLLVQVLTGGLVGAIVAVAAAVTNFVAARRRDREQWAREDRLRDYEERRSAYATFLRLADRRHSGAPSFMDEAARVDSYNEFIDALNQVRLIGPSSVSGAADHLEVAIRYSVCQADYNGLKSAFVAAARGDLGKPPEGPHEPTVDFAETIRRTVSRSDDLDGGAYPSREA